MKKTAVGALIVALSGCIAWLLVEKSPVSNSNAQPREVMRSGLIGGKAESDGRLSLPPDEEMSPSDDVDREDAPPPQVPAMDSDSLCTLDPSSLCDSLSRLIVKGESEDTILLSDEIVLRGDAADPSLKRMLHSGNTAVETVAMRLLIRIGTPSSMVIAMERVINGSPSDAEEDVIKQFANVRNAAVADALVNMAKSVKGDESRVHFSKILRNMEGTAVVEALAKSAVQTTDPSVSAYSRQILAGMNKPSGFPALETILDTGGSPELQAAAASALATIGNGKACESLENHASNCPCCIDAIAQIKSPYAQKALLNIVRTDKTKAVRNAALTALSRYKSPELASELSSIASGETDEEMGAQISNTARQINELCESVNGASTNSP